MPCAHTFEENKLWCLMACFLRRAELAAVMLNTTSNRALGCLLCCQKLPRLADSFARLVALSPLRPLLLCLLLLLHQRGQPPAGRRWRRHRCTNSHRRHCNQQLLGVRRPETVTATSDALTHDAYPARRRDGALFILSEIFRRTPGPQARTTLPAVAGGTSAH